MDSEYGEEVREGEELAKAMRANGMDGGAAAVTALLNAITALSAKVAEQAREIERLKIPDGWVLVPKEPTEAMVRASFSVGVPKCTAQEYIAMQYRAMISAVQDESAKAQEPANV